MTNCLPPFKPSFLSFLGDKMARLKTTQNCGNNEVSKGEWWQLLWISITRSRKQKPWLESGMTEPKGKRRMTDEVLSCWRFFFTPDMFYTESWQKNIKDEHKALPTSHILICYTSLNFPWFVFGHFFFCLLSIKNLMLQKHPRKPYFCQRSL